MSTILKWAGNKTAVMHELKKHLPAGPRLVEPFAGSCAVMMATEYPHYLVADVNPDLINLYSVIKDDADHLISIAKDLFAKNNSAECYYDIRKEFNHGRDWPAVCRSAMFIFLNRHGYRGLCRYNLKGHFNVPYGNYKAPYFPESEIRAFAEKAKRATFICASYEETLAMLQSGMLSTAILRMTVHFPLTTLTDLPRMISIIWRLSLSAGHQKAIRSLFRTATLL